jgi:acid stress-induced BolA-like protein IbaG/YrbA
MTLEEIKSRLTDNFQGAQIDVSGEGCSAEVQITSDLFDGQRLLQRQRSVLSLFAEEIKSGEIHALSVKAKTPKELE